MILLGTDVISLLFVRHERIVARFAAAATQETVATTIFTRAEILRARCEFLLKAGNADEVFRAQRLLERSEQLLNAMHIVHYDDSAARAFATLRQQKRLRKIGLADTLIASIVVASNATLVTHFRQIPQIKVENWAD